MKANFGKIQYFSHDKEEPILSKVKYSANYKGQRRLLVDNFIAEERASPMGLSKYDDDYQQILDIVLLPGITRSDRRRFERNLGLRMNLAKS